MKPIESLVGLVVVLAVAAAVVFFWDTLTHVYMQDHQIIWEESP
jgi:hypothetical protein